MSMNQLFRVGWDEERGRVLVANHAIEVGMNVIVDRAFAYSSNVLDAACCVCMRRLLQSDDDDHRGAKGDDEINWRCERCHLLFCNGIDNCEGGGEKMRHDNRLCESMERLRTISLLTHVELGLVVLVFKACLALVDHSSEEPDPMYTQVVQMLNQVNSPVCKLNTNTASMLVDCLETHREDIDPEHLHSFRECAEMMLELVHGACPVSPSRMTSDDIIDVFCKIFVNAHGLCPPGFRTCDAATGLFPMVSLMSHSCIPNCCFSTICDRIYVRSIRQIDEGEELSIPYVSLMNPTHIRRKALLESKYFMCNCQRCKSSTECGLYLRSFKCNMCQNGYASPVYSCDVPSNKEEHHVEIKIDNLFTSSDFDNNLDNMSFDDAFDAFDDIYCQEQSVSNFELLQKIDHLSCSSCGMISPPERVDELESSIQVVLSDLAAGKDKLLECFNTHLVHVHQHHFLMFALRARQLEIHLNKTCLSEPQDINQCFEYLIEFSKFNCNETAEYNLQYALSLRDNGGESELIKELGLRVRHHYSIIYPEEHPIHQVLLEAFPSLITDNS